ncbi:MAG TPA: cyclic-di-AMP receptor [Anaerolineales bacterium]|nr:cyclic-di-AMP receptor [Anaerolineales bacterium]
MKLIIAIVRDIDKDPVSDSLLEAQFRVTQVSSTGGWLRRGSSTLMIGVEDEKLDKAMQIIRSHLDPSSTTESKKATLFVLNVDHHTQI